MLSTLIIHPEKDRQVEAAEKALLNLKISRAHPDLLWIEPVGKCLGIKDIKPLREHLSFKPQWAQGKVVVIIGADNITVDAQNSLLKILEEPPQSASIILTASSENSLLPTILSRCELVSITEEGSPAKSTALDDTVKELIKADMDKRFEIIDSVEDKDALLEALVTVYSQKLKEDPSYLELCKLLIEAQKWNKAQGNTRAILEYLMLNL